MSVPMEVSPAVQEESIDVEANDYEQLKETVVYLGESILSCKAQLRSLLQSNVEPTAQPVPTADATMDAPPMPTPPPGPAGVGDWQSLVRQEVQRALELNVQSPAVFTTQTFVRGGGRGRIGRGGGFRGHRFNGRGGRGGRGGGCGGQSYGSNPSGYNGNYGSSGYNGNYGAGGYNGNSGDGSGPSGGFGYEQRTETGGSSCSFCGIAGHSEFRCFDRKRAMRDAKERVAKRAGAGASGQGTNSDPGNEREYL
ncbi:hypothetical protein BV898_10754 [Hypsibius exemplaris]|uniref:Uncharacterized protein n=1 Tax=Hypsibius exemplaris TaxID=2072580 RepID=A0A1W0WIF3_HYPEX|nr:hypothetical protein BV898_10754 [Hypsibius exemplaris]